MRLLGALLALNLSACADLGALFPKGRCVAYGLTVRVTLPEGRAHPSAGCIESAPYPGMPRPGR